ncbi:ERI1 exoribonuclease 3 isoform X3 [Nycticebus coucang]|uniref:ERI1 exoribonuclease 3 isoform X3 n=1 Tax=Nycticebus coucang TaxID=9470 RepID=UPI00234C1256|nr:ERI1 exoribonuclease 3 isoform X3 [Nycticebus coucang]
MAGWSPGPLPLPLRFPGLGWARVGGNTLGLVAEMCIYPQHWGIPALTEPSASPAASLGIFEVRRVLDASGCSMLAPLQTGAARFSSYLLSRARKVLGSHLFSPCGVPEFCSISTRKLAAHGFGASMAAMVSFPPQRYHYFLVLDFEATCDKPQIHPQEIIEFPILKLNGRTMEIESTFHMYVQPVVHPQLTPFCTELTGIIQAMVDGQPSLQQVLERVDEWMAKEGLLDPNVKSIFVTCGDWDLKVMLPGQCQYLGLPIADYFKQWINLKKTPDWEQLNSPGRAQMGIQEREPLNRVCEENRECAKETSIGLQLRHGLLAQEWTSRHEQGPQPAAHRSAPQRHR